MAKTKKKKNTYIDKETIPEEAFIGLNKNKNNSSKNSLNREVSEKYNIRKYERKL